MARVPLGVDIPRREKALTMKIGGATDAKIAEECGYFDAASANRAVQAALRNVAVNHNAAQLRALILERREQAHRALARDALVGKDREAMRLLLANLDGIAKLAGLNVNEARLAGAAEVTAVADLAAASMLQASLIGVLHEVGLPVETIDRVIDLLNARMGAQEATGGDWSDDDGSLVVQGEVEGS